VTARLDLPANLRAELESEARKAFPRECCGLIEGVRDGDTARALALHPTRNLAEEPDRFEIDPAAQFALMRRARAAGHAIIGCYHSHPNGVAEPSARDRESAGEEGFVWVIAGVGQGGAVAFGAFEGPDLAAISLGP